MVEVTDDTERWYNAYCLAHDQAVANGEDAGRLRTQVSELRAQLDAAIEALADANASVIAFGAPWAATWARDFGLPDGHLHPTHYDILEKAGGCMTSFTRAKLKEGKGHG